MAPLTQLNSTAMTLPPGYTNHGVKNLLCSPADWIAILTFYGVNYVAHCATVKYYPAESISEKLSVSVIALFFPSAGIVRAIEAIIRRSRLRKGGELQQAAFAGALLMVVRNSDWKPTADDRLFDIMIPDEEFKREQPGKTKTELASDIESGAEPQGDQIPLMSLQGESSNQITGHEESSRILSWSMASPPWMKQIIPCGIAPDAISKRNSKIHGLIGKLPEGYCLAYLPNDAVVVPNTEGVDVEKYVVSSNYDFAKVLLSIVQTCYAAFTLYQARGDQTAIYGYAAFGLTVLPYLIMSIVNLLAQFVTADYDAFYLVHSPEMDEAKRRGAVFEGIIGRIIPDEAAKDPFSGPWLLERRQTEGNSTAQAYYLVLCNENSHSDLISRRLEPKAKEEGDNANIWIPHSTRFRRLLKYDYEPRERTGWKYIKDAGDMMATESSMIYLLAPLLFVVLILAVIGGLTEFRRGSSTSHERGFVLSWILVGGLLGFMWRAFAMVFQLHHKNGLAETRMDAIMFVIMYIILFGVFFVPAIGGFVVVGKMLVEFGICSTTN